jgi:transcription initiation factor TFIIIB Brf1 subunit/transcription initiation factor TFIIB
MYGSITQWLPPPDPSGPVSCAMCGCRLVDAESLNGPAWRHFPSLHPGQDARGCRTVCVDELHDRRGQAIEGRTEHVAFLIDEGMDESLLPGREDAAAA